MKYRLGLSHVILCAVISCEAENSVPVPEGTPTAPAFSKMTWNEDSDDHYASFLPIEGNAFRVSSGKRATHDMTSQNKVWIGCIDKEIGILLYFFPVPDNWDLKYALGVAGEWNHLPLKTYGPYGMAKYTYPGVKDPIPLLSALQNEPIIRFQWSLPELRNNGQIKYDAGVVELTYNLAKLAEATEKSSAHCTGWPVAGTD